MKKLALLLSALVFVSCSTNNNEKNESVELNLKTNTSFNFNKYEFDGRLMTAGEIHNFVLEDLLTGINPREENITIEQMNNYLTNKYGISVNRMEIYNVPEDYLTNSSIISNNLRLVYFDIYNEISNTYTLDEKKGIIYSYLNRIDNFNLSSEDKLILSNSLSVYLSSLDFWNVGYGSTLIDINYNSQNKDYGGEVAGTDWASAVIGGALGANPVSAFFGAVIGSAWEYATNEGCWEEQE